MFEWLFGTSGDFVRIPLPCRGRLYASPMPFGPYDPFRQVFRSYRKAGIDVAVVLVTDDEISRKCKKDLLSLYRSKGIEVVHSPIRDLTSPSVEQMTELVDRITAEIGDRHRRVAIHCNAGTGRTAVAICCVVRRITGCTAEEAIEHVKQDLHINMTDEQRRLLRKLTGPSETPEAATGC